MTEFDPSKAFEEEQQRLAREAAEQARLDEKRNELTMAAAHVARELVSNEVEIDYQLTKKGDEKDADAFGWHLVTRKEKTGEKPGRTSVAEPDEEPEPIPIYKTVDVVLSAAGEIVRLKSATPGDENATEIPLNDKNARHETDTLGLIKLAAKNELGDPFQAEPIEELDEFIDKTREIVAEKGLNLGEDATDDDTGRLEWVKAKLASAKEKYSNLSKKKKAAILGGVATLAAMSILPGLASEEETGPPPRPEVSASAESSPEPTPGTEVDHNDMDAALENVFTDVAIDNAAEGRGGQVEDILARDPNGNAQNLPDNYPATMYDELAAKGEDKWETNLIVENCGTGDAPNPELGVINKNCKLIPVNIDPQTLIDSGLVRGNTYQPAQ